MWHCTVRRYNEQHGYPTSHQWFAQWEAKGDYTIRYFLEPVALSVNYAVKLGYKHIYMMGELLLNCSSSVPALCILACGGSW